MLRVGAHTSIAGGLHQALERGAVTGCDVVQIFTSSQRQWAVARIEPEAMQAWKQARQRTGVVPAMVHGSYLVNLAASTRALRQRSYRALATEYRRCSMLGISELIIHPGAHTGDGEATGIARIVEALCRLLDAHPDNPTRVLFENTAGQGTNLGCRFEQLRDLLGGIDRVAGALGRVGICIDTCHTFAAGYDLRTAAAWRDTFERFDAVVGCRHIHAFHVNDSKVSLGARVDRHEHLGRGHLGLTPFRCLVNDARFAGLPMVIETPRPSDRADVVNLAILRALAGRSRVGDKARRLVAEPLGPRAH